MRWRHDTPDEHKIVYNGVEYIILNVDGCYYAGVSENNGALHSCKTIAAAKTHVYREIIKSVKVPCPKCGTHLQCSEMWSMHISFRDYTYGLYCEKCDSTVISIITEVKRPMLAEIALYQTLRTIS